MLTHMIDIDETVMLAKGQGHKVKGQGHIYDPLSKGAKKVLTFFKSAQQVFTESYILENNTSV